MFFFSFSLTEKLYDSISTSKELECRGGLQTGMGDQDLFYFSDFFFLMANERSFITTGRPGHCKLPKLRSGNSRCWDQQCTAEARAGTVGAAALTSRFPSNLALKSPNPFALLNDKGALPHVPIPHTLNRSQPCRGSLGISILGLVWTLAF